LKAFKLNKFRASFALTGLWALTAGLSVFAGTSVVSAPTNTKIGCNRLVKETSEQDAYAPNLPPMKRVFGYEADAANAAAKKDVASECPARFAKNLRPREQHAFSVNSFVQLRVVKVRDGSLFGSACYSLGAFDGIKGYRPFTDLGSRSNPLK